MQKHVKRPDGSLNVIEMPEGESQTQQQYRDQVDINNIMKRYIDTGEIPLNTRIGQYLDTSNLPSYQKSLDIVMAAESAFMEMPAHLRTKFDNDPQKFIDYLDDPKNNSEAISLGLKVKKQESNDEKILKELKTLNQTKQKTNDDNIPDKSPKNLAR